MIDITPTGNVNDTILGATAATLDGELRVLVNAGNYIEGTSWLVIDAPVTGTFSTVSEIGDVGVLLDIDVEYSSVILRVVASRIFEDQQINPGVPSDVASCFTCCPINPNSDFAIVTEVLGTLSDEEVNEALFNLSAVDYGAFEWINARNNSMVARMIGERLFDLCCSCTGSCGTLWIAGYGNLMDNHNDRENLRPYDANSPGVIAGLNGYFDSFGFGAAAGYTHTGLCFDEDSSEGFSNTFYGSVYGDWTCSCITADVAVIGGGSCNHLDRELHFGSINRVANGDFWSYFVTAHLGLRSLWEAFCSNWEPFGSIDYHYYTHDGFTETGANSINLFVRSHNQHFILGEAGLRWYKIFTCDCVCIAPYLGISWMGEFPLETSRQPAQFIGRDCVIDSISYEANHNHLIVPQIGVKMENECGFTALVGYKGFFNDCTRIHQIEASAEKNF